MYEGSQELLDKVRNANVSVGAGGSLGYVAGGGSADVSFALDFTPNACVQATICGTAVPGGILMGGEIGGVAALGYGPLSSGESTLAGAFRAGGNGVAGQGQILFDTATGAPSLSRGFLGIGELYGAGLLSCTQYSSCAR